MSDSGYIPSTETPKNIIKDERDEYGKTDYERKTDKSVQRHINAINSAVGFPHHDVTDEVRKQLSLQRDELTDVMYDMWGLICNVNPVPDSQSEDWYKAFLRVRARFHIAIKNDFEE